MIKRYDSIAALREAYITGKAHRTGGPKASEWFNNESESDVLRFTLTGNVKLVPAAERLLAQLDTAIETPRKVWQRSPAGAFCNVADYLAGLPTPMRRQTYTLEETAPITIFATTTSSATVDAETMEKRGVVILALVLALSRIRPITLHQLSYLDGKDDGETIITAEINTCPLDLATACYVLTSAGFARTITYGVGRVINNFSGGWPRGFLYEKPELYHNRILPMLTSDPSRALIIGAAHIHDELIQTPIPWLNKQIARFTQTQEENAL